jgi:hypothetical protein
LIEIHPGIRLDAFAILKIAKADADVLSVCPLVLTKNSVFSRLLASCSFTDLADRMLSISSMKIMAGCRCLATANSARTSFSPSPTHLEVSDAALESTKAG